jgi:hypothetical protein
MQRHDSHFRRGIRDLRDLMGKHGIVGDSIMADELSEKNKNEF